MDMPRDDEIRLAMGEMTPDQMRTARAAIRWILSRSARPEVALKMPKTDEILLACGNMTASELRTVQAALRWFINRHDLRGSV